MSQDILSPARFSNFEKEVHRSIQKSLDRRTSVFVDPTLEIRDLSYDGVKFSRKYRDLVTLILILQFSDYFKEFKDYVRYEIELYLERNLLFPELDACLKSKTITLIVLLSFSKYHNPHEIFGNILNEEQVERVLNLVQLRLQFPRRAKPLVYRRGYKDKGSLRPETKWLESSDYTFTKIQNDLEEKRLEYSDTVTRIVRECGDRLLHMQSN